MEATLQNALDIYSNLDDEEKILFSEIMKKRQIEKRREEIKINADETILAVREKRAKFGNSEDLIADLES